jgi:beta-lactam-binding protein with PASTA domain
MKISRINRFFNLLLGALAMIAVAIFSAYLAMRIAIHGREVKVPALAGLPLSEAARKANSLGLRLNIENRFYSAAVAPGHVLSQFPAPNSVVRREWAVRVTESLGPQQVSIPSLIGQTERPATIAIRRLGLELGAIAHIPAPGPSGIVLAQTPTPTTAGVESPRISLLLSAPLPDASPNPTSKTVSNAEPAPQFVMPSLAGLTLIQAAARASAAGLHIVSAEELAPPTAPATAPGTPTPSPATQPPVPAPQPSPNTVVAQSPPAGHPVKRGDPVKIALGH